VGYQPLASDSGGGVATLASARRKKKRKTQDYMAKHSEDGSRSSREELAGNKSSEQEQDPMASFHKGPVPLQGRKDIILLLLLLLLSV
jgi:ribosome assembly protein YihI (activator of Der GTPase)